MGWLNQSAQCFPKHIVKHLRQKFVQSKLGSNREVNGVSGAISITHNLSQGCAAHFSRLVCRHQNLVIRSHEAKSFSEFLMITVAAAPSDNVEAFPAVTVPPSLLELEDL